MENYIEKIVKVVGGGVYCPTHSPAGLLVQGVGALKIWQRCPGILPRDAWMTRGEQSSPEWSKPLCLNQWITIQHPHYSTLTSIPTLSLIKGTVMHFWDISLQRAQREYLPYLPLCVGTLCLQPKSLLIINYQRGERHIIGSWHRISFNSLQNPRWKNCWHHPCCFQAPTAKVSTG